MQVSGSNFMLKLCQTTGLRDTKIVKLNLKVSGVSWKQECFQRQSFTTYEIVHYKKSLISVFQEVFTSTDKIVVSGATLKISQNIMNIIVAADSRYCNFFSGVLQNEDPVRSCP